MYEEILIKNLRTALSFIRGTSYEEFTLDDIMDAYNDVCVQSEISSILVFLEEEAILYTEGDIYYPAVGFEQHIALLEETIKGMDDMGKLLIHRKV